MATFTEIDGWLTKEIRSNEIAVDTIIKKIKSLDKIKSNTATLLASQEDPYKNISEKNKQHHIKISDLYVDMTYQRPLRLRILLAHLARENTYWQSKFDPYLAGHIDVSIRPGNKKYVWDGLRRSVLAGLKGLDRIPASILEHPVGLKTQGCRKLEAELFEIKNAYSESMKREEIWKSQLIQGKSEAKHIYNILDNANLDVLHVVGSGIDMGAFSEVEKVINRNLIPDQCIIDASHFIQNAWTNDNSMRGYFLLGMAELLNIFNKVEEDENKEYNGNGDVFLNYQFDIPEKLSDYAKTKSVMTLQNPRVNGNVYGSIAYNIATKVLGIDPNDDILLEQCKLSEDEQTMLTI
tara:strand:- start:5016 stop:6068 length:1053 start_codon:yes stop_codon:yes gene_type:complete